MSKNRSFRPRNKLSFDEDEGQEDAGSGVKPPAQSAAAASKPPAPAASKPSAAPIPKKDSKPNLLSFDEDGGEDAGPLAGAFGGGGSKRKDKGSKSKFGRAQGLPDLPAAGGAGTQQPSAGEYTAERLKELQKNALSFSSAKFAKDIKSQATVTAPAASQEPLLKLSGTFKPAGAAKDDRFTLNPMDIVKEEPDRSRDNKSPLARNGAAGPSGRGSRPSPHEGPSDQQGGHTQAAHVDTMVIDGSEGEDEDGLGVIIPDQDTIRLAKAKRERLRQARLAPDYVPLGGASKLLAGAKGALTDASMAQEGEAQEGPSGSDGEADLEDAMRIKFSVTGNTKQSDQQQYSKVVTQDDDTDAFAEEQLRKAVSRSKAAMPQRTATPPQQESYAYHPSAPAYGYHQVAPPAGMYGGAGAGGAYAAYAAGAGGGTMLAGALSRSRMEAIVGAGQSVVNALREAVERLTTSHRTTQNNFTKTSANLDLSLQRIDQLEKDSKQASEKYMYVQEFRTYMSDLIDCLTHKSALVEELEDSLMELREDRARDTRDSVQTLESELMRVAQAAVSASVGVLGRGGAVGAAQQAAENAASAAEDDLEEETCGGPPQLDEFGRNVNIEKQREAKDRRRQRKDMVARELKRLEALSSGHTTSGSGSHTHGDEWDVENESQASRYTHRHDEIMTAAGTVFADAAEEFSSIGAVKQRLEEFKARYPKDYSNTYMHLSTPALFAPFVRLELLHWDPLYADEGQTQRRAADAAANGAGEREGVHKGFDKQAWYEGLFDYGMGTDPSTVSPDDPDGELVPQLVRKLVLPLAAHMIDKCWDPLRYRQCKAAALIVEDLLVYVPADEPMMSDVLDSVVSVLKNTVQRLDMPAWPPVAVDTSPLAKAVLSWRFHSAVRFLRGLSVWEGLLSRSVLLQLELSQLVSQQLQPYLRAAISDAAAQPQLAVSRVEAVAAALPAAWFAGGQPPEAKPFIDLMEALAKTLERHRDNTAKYASCAKRLAVELNRLGSQLQAMQLASAFNVTLT